MIVASKLLDVFYNLVLSGNIWLQTIIEKYHKISYLRLNKSVYLFKIVLYKILEKLIFSRFDLIFFSFLSLVALYYICKSHFHEICNECDSNRDIPLA